MKILVVDDEYSFCKNLRAFLARMGHEAVITTNGEHALDLLREGQPDVMTLDIRMPGMNGYEMLEKLKWEYKDMPVIVISAIDIPGMEDKLIHAGARAVLRKPVDLADLARTIENVAR